MKKIITLCLFSFAMLIATETTQAQTNERLAINTEANLKANELKKVIKFNDDELNEVYQAYEDYGSKMHSIEKHLKDNPTDYVKAQEDTKAILHAKMKDILIPEHFDMYMSIEQQH